MDKQELFKKIQALLQILATSRKTGTVVFKDMDEKITLKDVYAEIYPFTTLEMSCTSCVLSYLNHLESWYEREYPKYEAGLKETSQQEPDNKVLYQGIKQEKGAESGKKARKTRTKKQ